jgi:hypothetical protein
MCASEWVREREKKHKLKSGGEERKEMCGEKGQHKKTTVKNTADDNITMRAHQFLLFSPPSSPRTRRCQLKSSWCIPWLCAIYDLKIVNCKFNYVMQHFFLCSHRRLECFYDLYEYCLCFLVPKKMNERTT